MTTTTTDAAPAPATKAAKKVSTGTAAKRATQSAAKPTAKPAAKRATKSATPKSANTKSAGAKSTGAKSVTPKPTRAKPAKPGAKAAPPKAEKPKKPKLVRDSFTMPEDEYALLSKVKKLCVGAGMEIKKSELLRIGVSLLANMDTKAIKAAQLRLTPLKAGRPKKK